jgi:Divergent InlB B-repeat domain
MYSIPRVVAAALLGSLAAALVVVALAAGSESRTTAKVTLQIAPRGLGTVSVQPPGLDSDNQPVSDCTDNEGGQSCTLSFDRGQSVTLTAKGDPGRTLAKWSTPDCLGTGPCNLTLNDDVSSIVAVFTPLRLGVRLSNIDAGQVTTDPVGKACAQDPNDGADQCFEFPPETQVKVTMTTNPGHTFQGWNPGCEPTNAPTCTVTVRDEPTWVGARFDTDDAPPLPTSISVQFQLKLGGDGSGRVTGTKLDCGTVCSAQYDYGTPLTLTVAKQPGSIFDGWNGVCAKTQTTCTFPVGPITSIQAQFVHDATPPSIPGGLTIAGTTRTGISITWTASTDNVGVTGYRAYLNGAAVGDTTGTDHTFSGLACGRSYAVSVDAVDAVGNRSAQGGITARTRPCRLAARVAGVSVKRTGRDRSILVNLRVNRLTSARMTLRTNRSVVASGRYRVKPGSNPLRLRVPRTLRGGPYHLAITLVNPDGGTLALPARNLLLPRP